MIAVFKFKRVYGTPRYYPVNKVAFLLVVLKRAATVSHRKKTVKCLSKQELVIVQKMGVTVELT